MLAEEMLSGQSFSLFLFPLNTGSFIWKYSTPPSWYVQYFSLNAFTGERKDVRKAFCGIEVLNSEER